MTYYFNLKERMMKWLLVMLLISIGLANGVFLFIEPHATITDACSLAVALLCAILAGIASQG